MKPYYEHGGITIFHGDCREVLPSVSGVDLAFTSPPYNLGGEPWPHLGNWKHGDSAGGKSKWRNGSDGANGVTYLSHNDSMDHSEYVEWQRDCLSLMWSSLSDNGAIFYNHKPRVIGGRLWLPLELNPELPIRQIVTWARAGGMNFNPTAFVPTMEWVLIFARPSWRLRDRAASGAGDVWRIAQQPDDEHPASFPVQLPKIAIEATESALILDPFMGTGSTLRAAKNLNRRAIGIELQERYCEIAAQRLSQEVMNFDEPLLDHRQEAQETR